MLSMFFLCWHLTENYDFFIQCLKMLYKYKIYSIFINAIYLSLYNVLEIYLYPFCADMWQEITISLLNV